MGRRGHTAEPQAAGGSQDPHGLEEARTSGGLPRRKVGREVIDEAPTGTWASVDV